MIFVAYALGIVLLTLGVLRAWTSFRVFLNETHGKNPEDLAGILGRGLLSAVGIVFVGIEVLLAASTAIKELPLWPAMTGLICLLGSSIWAAVTRRTKATPR